ncbi:hypothetical protein IKF30_02525 [Candidatus Saccharibacteria bacterium]|nr:hypothetical protein [Candidatus Saccharibacteria bacterium]
MKRKTIKTLVLSLAMLSPILCHTTAFAAENYGITYSGGEPLGSNNNVTISPTIVDSLSQILQTDGVELTYSNSSKWETGYTKTGEECRPTTYVKVTNSNPITENDNLSVTIPTDSYNINVDIKSISLDITSGNPNVAVGFQNEYSYVWGSIKEIYSDNSCTTPISGIDNLAWNGNKVFVETSIKIYKKGKSEVFTSDELYLGMTDIDAGQSYKVLNENNKIATDILYAKDPADLQPDASVTNLKNMFVTNDNYIYSQIANGASFNIDVKTRRSDVFLKLNTAAQAEGLRVVFGFTGDAGSGIEFYAKQYEVKYVADTGGKITGITDEQVISGKNPSGSSKQPDEEYKFTHWTTDVKLTLKDNRTIEAGEEISEEDIKNVVVHQNITFTAHFEPIIKYVVKYEADEGGKITGIAKEDVEAGNNPTGSKEEADKGYQLVNWTADVDVPLEDETTIKAGDPITAEQIKKVVVNQNITFTAHYKKQTTPVTPNTGASTKGLDAATIATISVIGVLGIALFIRFLPQITHKKIGFEK